MWAKALAGLLLVAALVAPNVGAAPRVESALYAAGPYELGHRMPAPGALPVHAGVNGARFLVQDDDVNATIRVADATLKTVPVVACQVEVGPSGALPGSSSCAAPRCSLITPLLLRHPQTPGNVIELHVYPFGGPNAALLGCEGIATSGQIFVEYHE